MARKSKRESDDRRFDDREYRRDPYYRDDYRCQSRGNYRSEENRGYQQEEYRRDYGRQYDRRYEQGYRQDGYGRDGGYRQGYPGGGYDDRYYEQNDRRKRAAKKKGKATRKRQGMSAHESCSFRDENIRKKEKGKIRQIGQGNPCHNLEVFFLDKYKMLLYNYILHHHGQIYAKFLLSYHSTTSPERQEVCRLL